MVASQKGREGSGLVRVEARRVNVGRAPQGRRSLRMHNVGRGRILGGARLAERRRNERLAAKKGRGLERSEHGRGRRFLRLSSGIGGAVGFFCVGYLFFIASMVPFGLQCRVASIQLTCMSFTFRH